MNKSILFLSLFLSGQYAIADGISSCPDASEIKHNQGVYTVDSGQWFGVSVGLENSGEVGYFLKAIYVPYKKFGMDFGILKYCTYSLASGYVNIRYLDTQAFINGGTFISLIGHMFWEKNTLASSDQEYYMCTSTSASQCTFTRLEHYIVEDYQNRD